jgi:hypothetical protein
MPRKNDAFAGNFIEGLRRDTSRWKAELSLLDAGDAGTGRHR